MIITMTMMLMLVMSDEHHEDHDDNDDDDGDDDYTWKSPEADFLMCCSTASMTFAVKMTEALTRVILAY